MKLTTVLWDVPGKSDLRIEDLLIYTSALRGAVVRAFGDSCPEYIHGKSADGKSLIGHHHAHYLAFPDSSRTLLNRFALYVPHGLTVNECNEIAKIAKLYVKRNTSGDGSTMLNLMGIGDSKLLLNDYASGAKEWRSATPFLPNRHKRVKYDVLNYVRSSVFKAIDDRNITQPVLDVFFTKWLKVNKSRVDRTVDLVDSFDIHLTFKNASDGLLILGDNSHFGYGLFRGE